MVSLGQFSEGLTGRRADLKHRSRLWGWLFAAAPVAVVVVWVLARVARH
jgi:hypothetical protein